MSPTGAEAAAVAWLAKTVGGQAIASMLKAGRDNRLAKKTIAECMVNAMRTALVDQVGDDTEREQMAEVLVFGLWGNQLPRQLILDFEVAGDATPWQRLRSAATAHLSVLDITPFSDEQGSPTQAEVLALDTSELADNFCIHLKEQLALQLQPPTVVALAGSLEAGQSKERAENLERQLVAIYAELKNVTSQQGARRPADKVVLAFEGPLSVDPDGVAALVSGALHGGLREVAIEWPAYTAEIRQQLERQEADRLQGRLRSKLADFATTSAEKQQLDWAVHVFSEVFREATTITIGLPRRLLTLPQRCATPDEPTLQRVVARTLVLANVYLVSLMGQYQLRTEAVQNDLTIPFSAWPDVLFASPVWGAFAMDAANRNEGIRRIELRVKQDSADPGSTSWVYAPDVVGRTVLWGMFPDFVWSWAVPQLELDFARRAHSNTNGDHQNYRRGSLRLERDLGVVSGPDEDELDFVDTEQRLQRLTSVSKAL